MRLTLTTALLAGLLTIPEVLFGCGSVPTTQSGMNAKMETVVPSANQAVNAMLAKDTSLKPLMDDAYGYIIFPSVASGALIVGGEGGDYGGGGGEAS